ncbi:MAG: indole-3-glycerol phosphate synthase [Candidatus Altiarchaeales archaeon ex4484_2]|nr:MAG: indole-3-glycerol phosphate synthase [Candidatus Altiarchaeales archaeon ex4484_2]
MTFNLDTIGSEKLHEIKVFKEKRSLISAIKDAKRNNLNAVITEIKRRSPSRGYIKDVDLLETAESMEAGGASAISVLTDKRFGGDLSDLRRVKSGVEVPVLRKDFIVDEFQIYEGYAYGADAVLLIVSLLKGKTGDFVELAHGLGMEALVEVHSVDELGFALDSGARLVGVNNRDLGSLRIDLDTIERLAPKIPKNKLIVSESGINNKEDLKRVLYAEADAALIGTSIMLAEDIKEKVMEFTKR